MSIVVADAGPLIALATISKLNLLPTLYQKVWIPEAVQQELRLDSDMPGAQLLKRSIAAGWLQCVQHNYPQASYQQLSQILDTGEIEAILLAEHIAQNDGYRFLLIDEYKGRKIATNRGVTIAGSGAVLLAAKKHGHIDSLKNVLDAMRDSGYRMSDALQDRLLVLAGES